MTLPGIATPDSRPINKNVPKSALLNLERLSVIDFFVIFTHKYKIDEQPGK